MPSNIDIQEDFTTILELDVYGDYEFTKNKLQEIYETSNRKIPCSPKSKLISDNMIVGIKTITNQIVPVIPIPKTDGLDDLDEEVSYASYENVNNLLNDEEMLTSESIDEERSKMIKKIELENNFYKLFRDTLKIIINQSSKREEKTEILNLVTSPTIPYIEKLINLIPILQSLLEPAVNFNTDFELVSLEDYTDMITCFGLDTKKKCDANAPPCTFMRENTCELSLPNKNLYSNSDNRTIYFKKLADEIIRYSKIRKYIFTSREFLSFERVNYKINDNEIILLEELLLESYLEDIRLRQDNKYINTTNIYDIVNPNNKITYNTTFNQGKSEISNCIDKSKMIDAKYLNTLIKDSSDKIKFIHYKPSISCMFEPIITIIKDYTKKKSISINDIKNKLIDAYLKLEMPQTTLIANRELGNVSNWSVFTLINYYYGRKKIAKSIIDTTASNKDDKIELQIKETDYKINEIDMFLIFKEYKIPVIIKMKTKGSLLNKSVKIFDTSSSADENIYMILYYSKLARRSDYLGLAQKDKKYKIPKEILQDNLLEGEKDIGNYLTTSLKKKEKEKEIKKIQDREALQRKREKDKKVTALKVKGKMRLPSE